MAKKVRAPRNIVVFKEPPLDARRGRVVETRSSRYDLGDAAELLDLAAAEASDPEAVRLDVATKASGYDGTAPDQREGREGRKKRAEGADAAEDASDAEDDDEDASDAGEDDVDAEALRAEFLARARLDAPDEAAPRTSFFDGS